ncbi:FG-GAP-like repeat-containing protein [Streptomyces sp. NPDC089919]|uniref:FG-GAP-like repeat-containing protein n=1 Tax=Streptomyces sp. NPDC089919 TaxID=3155188 RepID=UPI00341299A7
MSEEDYALAQAKSTGAPYELTSARTESTDTWALPDGSWSVKRYGSVIRLLRDGVWVPADPTLVFAADGSVVSKASAVDVTFSGGGTAALLTGVKDGRSLSLTWPKALPKPTLAANVATYAEVLPGVDLQLKAEVEGFSQLLVVKTAAAAQNPELATLRFKLGTVGLDVSADPDTGSLTAVNPAGQTVFSSPSPLMWDSTTADSGGQTVAKTGSPAAAGAAEAPVPGPEAPSEAAPFDPKPGAQDAQMPTTVSGDTLEIKPDPALLKGPDTTYPVYIDPSFAWGEKQHWARVYKHYPRMSFFDTKDPIRVGYESQSGGSDRISRSFVQLDTSDTRYAQVKSSVFRIRNTWSWSCEDRPVELWHTGPISKKTTWEHQPGKIARLDTVNDSKGWSSKYCDAGNLEFDATAKMQEAARGGWSHLTLGLYASNEADTFGWKKFDARTAVLETVYNNPPKKPENTGTSPRTSCSAGGLIGNTRVSLYATLDDKDAGNLTAEFQLFKAGATTASVTMSKTATKGKVVTWPVPDADLPTGNWTWKVRGKDQDGATGPWSDTCKFTVDRTRPSRPPVITSVNNQFPPGENGWPAGTGKARDAGKFAFAANGVNDVDHYVWWTDYDADPHDADPGIPATVRPPGYGPHFVYAYSMDKVGNRSDIATYVYYAGRSTERDGPDDLNGDGNRDIWSVDSNGTLLTYAGQGDGDFSAATNGGKSFPDGDVSSRGDWGQDGYNDLVSLEYDATVKKKKLWSYKNNGSGVIGAGTELTVTCPVPDEEIGCFGDEKWTGDDHWYNADQVVAPGDLNGDGQPDLLVKQGKYLWAYYGNRATHDLDLANTRAPVLVGGSDWDRFTVVAPGDLNGDKLADLWLREDATGKVFRAYGRKSGAAGQLDPATWGAPGARVEIATGYQASAYPSVGSSGDVTGDGLPDLWARKTDNTMIGWYGKIPGADNKSFGSPFVIDGITGGSRIPAGTKLTGGQSLTSRSAKLTLQDDGNLVVTSNAGKVLWSTRTGGNPGATAVMRHDGNLVVLKADGVTVAWQSRTSAAEGYAMLQDRGDLVVFDVKSQSVWSSGSSLRHDYTGDGRSDMADWYDYGDGHDSIHLWQTGSDGLFQTPRAGWSVPAGNYYNEHMKRVTGDYNGDGIGDVAAIYGYADGSVGLFTWTGKGDGTFNAAAKSWSAAPGNWTFSRMTPYSGDFNGDGRDDLAVWYDFADLHDTVFVFTTSAKGAFNPPRNAWTAVNSWEQARAKTVSGDFNGDGRDDLLAFYGYADGSEKMWTFTATAAGTFVPTASWSSATWGDWARTSLFAGDFNGDGRDDVGTWYDYADEHDAVIVFPSAANGSFSSSYEAWTSPAGNWYRPNVKLVTGDYNGDGRDDLGGFYGYEDGSVRSFTWATNGDGKLGGATAGWSTEPGNWTRERAHFLDQQTSAE